MVRIFFEGRISREARNLYKLFIRKIEKVVSVPHRVAIVITDQPVVFWHYNRLRHLTRGQFRKIDKKDAFAIGTFRSPSRLIPRDRKNWDCVILIAGNSPANKYGTFHSAADTILHEVGHYIQFRDKKKLCEKGIDQIVVDLWLKLFEIWGDKQAQRFSDRLKKLPIRRGRTHKRLGL